MPPYGQQVTCPTSPTLGSSDLRGSTVAERNGRVPPGADRLRRRLASVWARLVVPLLGGDVVRTFFTPSSRPAGAGREAAHSYVYDDSPYLRRTRSFV